MWHRHSRRWRWQVVAELILVVAAVGECSAVDFTKDILPILQRRCFGCHEGRDAKAGRRLDQRREWLGTAGSEPLVTVGDSDASRVIALISARDPDVVMPPEGPRLSQREVNFFREWVDAGLPWDLRRLPNSDAALHWSFQPIQRPELPDGEGPAAIFHPVDRFIVAKYRELDLQAAPMADHRTLIRRLSLNLTGLPPSPAEVEHFVRDDRPDAYERLADRLLASPRYGERWGRHWLDIARWAESEGYESNHPRPAAWRYRDYVIDSFNHDRPFDQFVRQQIAGDEISPYSHENLIATGFLAAARISSNEEDKWRQRNDVYVDIVNAVGNAFLGLTIQCAQCHDHKFDPITARDYYQLQAFFVRGQPVAARLRGSAAEDATSRELRDWNSSYEAARRRLIKAESKRFSSTERAALMKRADQRSVEEELLARRTDVQIPNSRKNIEKYFAAEDGDSLGERKKHIEKLRAELAQTFCFYSPVDSPHPLDVIPSVGFYPLPYDEQSFALARPYVMRRGDVHSIGASVQAAWPGFLVKTRNASEGSSDFRTRTDLADWLTDPSNPLVARVWVNRIWHYHFGRGLVATVDDFGIRGARPTHPALLDWLGAELIDSGWSTRHIQRLIVTSRTYRLASSPTPSARVRDPDNLFLTRWIPRRLEVEAIRDSWLAISGQLERRKGGVSVPEEAREQSRRRSVYLFQRRGKPPAMLRLFDGPNECSASRGQRNVSISPLQSLYSLNSEFSLAQARSLAERIDRDSDGDIAEAIELAFRRTLQRVPTPGELSSSRRLLRTLERDRIDSTEEDSDSAPTPMTLFCQALLNLSEVCYIE